MFNPQALIQMMSMLQSSGNPQAMMMQQFGNNPQFHSAMQMLQGKNPQQIEQMARQIAQQQGINIDQLLQQMRQFGINM